LRDVIPPPHRSSGGTVDDKDRLADPPKSTPRAISVRPTVFAMASRLLPAGCGSAALSITKFSAGDSFLLFQVIHLLLELFEAGLFALLPLDARNTLVLLCPLCSNEWREVRR